MARPCLLSLTSSSPTMLGISSTICVLFRFGTRARNSPCGKQLPKAQLSSSPNATETPIRAIRFIRSSGKRIISGGNTRMRTMQVVLAGFTMLAASALALAGPPSGGTVSGKVTYEGTPAKMKPIDMSKEPVCAKMYTTPPTSESVVTGPGNTLEDVVVYVSAGAPDDAAPSTAATFTQKGCRYIPHVLA